MNNISVKKTEIRQLKEREQIVYQVKHLTEDSDKIKLNEQLEALKEELIAKNTILPENTGENKKITKR